MARVLIIEDEGDIATMVSEYLESHGHTCECVTNAMAAQRSVSQEQPDIVLLDWMLPGRSGYEFAKALRASAKTRNLPIIMLTARDDESSKIQALDVGADDYVTKPFSLAELTARVNALLRRSTSDSGGATLEMDGLAIDRGTRRISAAGTSVSTSPTEFELLFFLMSHPERVYSRSELIQYVWGSRVHVEERTVDVHVRRLRKVLAETGHDRLIQTVRGAGYRMSAQR